MLNILTAIESNDIDRVREAIDNGIKFTKQNSPLGLAAEIGNVEIGNVEIVSLLIDAGCKVEWGGHVQPSPLYLATHEGKIEVVKFLINRKAKLDYKDEDGCTPLMNAAGMGYLEIVKLLVEAGAKINIVGEHGDFALESAVSGAHQEIYEYLLPLTSSNLIKRVDTSLLYSEKLLLNAGAETQLKNQHGYTALMNIVTSSKSNEIIKLLFDAGANLDATDKFGNTAITIAYTASKSKDSAQGSPENVGFLKSLGASTDRFPEIDFIYNAGEGSIDRVINFINSGGNINCIDPHGLSALSFAALSNQVETLRILIDRGARIDRIAKTFVFAVALGYVEIVRELINVGVDVNAPEPNTGSFALSRAIENKNIVMVDILLKAGAKMPKKDPVFGDIGKYAKILDIDIYKLLVNH
jgi:ankyrin repeat protein